MKKRITFITFLMLLCSVSFGQNHWTPVSVDPTVYNQSMTVATTISFEGDEQDRDNLELGVFCNGVCRATTKTKDYGTGKYVAMTTFRGKSGEEYTLKVYDHSNNTEHSNYVLSDESGNELTDNTITFNADFFGTLIAPYNVNFVAPDHFIPEIGDYDFNMTLTAVVLIDGVEQKNAKLELGAFIGDKVVGSSKTDFTYTINEERFYANQMAIAGNDNDVVTFKLYDHANGEELEFIEINSITFETNKFLGTIAQPIEIDFLTKSYVAQIGETKYETLAAAVESAEDNATIALLKDAEGSGIVINKSITIDFGGFTYTFNEGVGNIPSNGFQILNGNTVTLQNGKLEVAETAASTFYILVQNYANLNVTKMTLDGKNLDKWSATDGDSYVLSNNSGNVNISESKIIANDEGSKAFAFDACKYTSYDAPYVTLDANSNIQGKVELSGGQLKSAQAVNATIKKDIEAYLDEDEDLNLESGWYTICFPFTFTDETIHNLADDDSYDLYRYDEAGAIWVNHKKHDSDNDGNEDQDQLPFGDITLGNGYLYAHASGKIIEATGKVNIAESTTVALTASNEGNLKGFNLIGNPYTHNITTDHFSDVTLAVGFYTLSNHGAWTAVENGSIAPMQGILVKTTEAGNLNIKKDINGKRSENEDNGSIMISVSNEKYTDVAYVSFNEGIGLDKIYHRNINVPMVYIPVENVNYAIATMSHDITEILVSFRAMTMGEYTISVKSQNCEYSSMTLVDRQTGTETNLLVEDYTFLAKTNDNADRFIIKLNNSQQSTDNSHFAYINNGMINIDNIVGQAMINVYDVTGRSVAKYNVSESVCISTSYFANGMYIIKMTDENGIKVQKIIIE